MELGFLAQIKFQENDFRGVLMMDFARAPGEVFSLRGFQLSNLTSLHRKVALAVAFAVIVILQAWSHLGLTQKGYPYENWDEIGAYNTSFVMSGPTIEHVWHYGTADGALQWMASATYLSFDPVGMGYPHIRYANNVPASWSDPYYAAHRVYQPGRLDYSYFRGTDDRSPLFTSRKLHLVAAYGLVLAIGGVAIFALGAQSILLIAPLLALTTGPSVYAQLAQSLPNGVNAILGFGVVLFAMLYAYLAKTRYLLVSVALLALGMNFKQDIIISFGSQLLALAYIALRQGPMRAVRDAALAFVVGVVVLTATDLSMLSDPEHNLRKRLIQLLEGGMSGDWHDNWRSFEQFLHENLLWSGDGVLGVLIVGVALLGFCAAAVFGWKQGAPVLLLGVAVTVVGWTLIVAKSRYHEHHYFFNAYSAFLATVAMALLIAYRQGRRWRRGAQIATAALGLIWAGHAVSETRDSLAQAALAQKHEGLDPAHNRNLATLAALDLLASGKYARTVLVDQHAYIDLRAFRLRGYDARYVNLTNLEPTLASLDPTKSYLTLFSPGNFDRGDEHLRFWENEWSPAMLADYAAYQHRLLSLPVARRIAGTPQPILSGQPIREKDEILVSVWSPTAGQAKPAS